MNDNRFVNDATKNGDNIMDVQVVPPSQIRSTMKSSNSCVDRGSFTFPGSYSYEDARRTCMRRDAQFFLYSYDLQCESGRYRQLYRHAFCLQNCATTAHVVNIAQDVIEDTYSGCRANNIDISTDVNVVKCMDETNGIESSIEMIKKKRDIPHSVVNGTVRFVDDDTIPYSNECYSVDGKIVSSSFTEEVMTNPNITTGSCPFTDILGLDQPDRAKVYNWPRCFGRSCSIQTVRKLMTLTQNPSKWYCQRDIFLMSFNSTDYFPASTTSTSTSGSETVGIGEDEEMVTIDEPMTTADGIENDSGGNDQVTNGTTGHDHDVSALWISMISISISSIIIGFIMTM